MHDINTLSPHNTHSGHVEEQDSIFSYGGLNYSTLNGGYLEFEPTFFDELNITQEVMDACGTNQACILDASLTGNLEIGTSTLNVSMENEELEMTLGEFVTFETLPLICMGYNKHTMNSL